MNLKLPRWSYEDEKGFLCVDSEIIRQSWCDLVIPETEEVSKMSTFISTRFNWRLKKSAKCPHLSPLDLTEDWRSQRNVPMYVNPVSLQVTLCSRSSSQWTTSALRLSRGRFTPVLRNMAGMWCKLQLILPFSSFSNMCIKKNLLSVFGNLCCCEG